jgi:hypothetical protein
LELNLTASPGPPREPTKRVAMDANPIQTTPWTAGSPMDERRQCTAGSKRSGQRCRRAPARGRTVCSMHGGRSLVGIASPAFRHGRYSRALPGGLAERYLESLADPELLSLRSEIALVDSRVTELLGRVGSGESGPAWRKLSDTWGAMVRARAAGEVGLARYHLLQLEGLITDGRADHAAWAEVYAALEQRRRLTESEWRRLVALRQVLTVEQAAVLVAAVADSVRRHVRDVEALRGVSEDLARLVSRDDLREESPARDGLKSPPTPPMARESGGGKHTRNRRR